MYFIQKNLSLTAAYRMILKIFNNFLGKDIDQTEQDTNAHLKKPNRKGGGLCRLVMLTFDSM